MSDDPAKLAEAELPVLEGILNPDDSKKMKYLAYRVCGFTVGEASELAGCHIKSVGRWRASDPIFARLDTDGLTDERKKFRDSILSDWFSRNFVLVLQKDLEVLMKSLDKDAIWTKSDHDYLLKLRGFYTPQQIMAMKQLCGEVKDGNGQFDFTKFTMTIQREREAIRIEAKEE